MYALVRLAFRKHYDEQVRARNSCKRSNSAISRIEFEGRIPILNVQYGSGVWSNIGIGNCESWTRLSTTLVCRPFQGSHAFKTPQGYVASFGVAARPVVLSDNH